MRGKLDEVRKLIAEGYEVEEVTSDHGRVEATLRRGARVVVVSFLPHEAEALLMLPSPLRS